MIGGNQISGFFLTILFVAGLFNSTGIRGASESSAIPIHSAFDIKSADDRYTISKNSIEDLNLFLLNHLTKGEYSDCKPVVQQILDMIRIREC